MFFYYNLVTVSLPIHMNNHVLIKFIESPSDHVYQYQLEASCPRGRGGGGGSTNYFTGRLHLEDILNSASLAVNASP